MSKANEILRSYVRLVARLSGAASVSLYVPPAAGEQGILIHEGRLGPLPELADPEAAAESDRRLGADLPGEDDAKGRLAGGSAEGLLYRIPLRWLMPRVEDEARGPRSSCCSARTTSAGSTSGSTAVPETRSCARLPPACVTAFAARTTSRDTGARSSPSSSSTRPPRTGGWWRKTCCAASANIGTTKAACAWSSAWGWRRPIRPTRWTRTS